MQIRLNLYLFFIVCGFVPSFVKAQRWVKLSPATNPSARHEHAMAYDSARKRVVMFGGTNGDRETWEWDGKNWIQHKPKTNPPARYDHAMVYDSARKRVVMFGGYNKGRLDDTWEWDGNNWTERKPVTKPLARSGHAMAYDSARKRVVMFAGALYRNDTWEWDGKNWIERKPVTKPPARYFRYHHRMAYDSARKRVVLFGGYDDYWFNDTWEWDGNNWTERKPAVKPPIRESHAMAYDSERRKIVMFGGFGARNLNDTWEWDGKNWTERKPAVKPSVHFGHAMAYDSARRKIVMFGGGNRNGALNDIWVYDARPGSYTVFGNGCKGSVGIPALSANPPLLAQTFAIKLTSLPPATIGFILFGAKEIKPPLDLTKIGMPNCYLYVLPIFNIPIGTGLNKTIILSMLVPNDPKLAGITFFNQAFIVEPPVNLLGLIATNAGKGTIGF